jgi:hypothetical protein
MKNINIKKVFILGMLSCFANLAIAQKYKVEKLSDNPTMGLTINLIPTYFDLNGAKPNMQTMSFGWGAEVGMDVTNRIRGNVRFLRGSYADILRISIPKDQFIPFQTFELGGNFMLTNKVKTEGRQLILHSSSSMSSTTMTTKYNYINTDLLVRNSWSVRGGLYTYKHMLDIREHGSVGSGNYKEGSIITADGTVLGNGADVYRGNVLATLKTRGFYAGTSIVTTINYKARLDNDFNRYHRINNEVYFDVILASPKPDDITAYDGTVFALQGGQAQGLEMKSTGWRLGWKLNNGNRGLFPYYMFELGSRPGMEKGNIYTTLAFGLGFSKGASPLVTQFEPKKEK